MTEDALGVWAAGPDRGRHVIAVARALRGSSDVETVRSTVTELVASLRGLPDFYDLTQDVLVPRSQEQDDLMTELMRLQYASEGVVRQSDQEILLNRARVAADSVLAVYAGLSWNVIGGPILPCGLLSGGATDVGLADLREAGAAVLRGDWTRQEAASWARRAVSLVPPEATDEWDTAAILTQLDCVDEGGRPVVSDELLRREFAGSLRP